MRKGVSTIITSVLILLIIAALSASAWLFLSNLFQSTKAIEEASFSEDVKRSGGCLRIESINSQTGEITLRNCGSISLSKFNVYVNHSGKTSDSRILNPGGILVIDLDIGEGSYNTFVTSDYAETTEIVFNVLRGACDVYINQSMIPFSINDNNKLYCLSENVHNESSADYVILFGNFHESILDCKGFSINSTVLYSGSGIRITSGSDANFNNTIKNCNINYFFSGIYVDNFISPYAAIIKNCTINKNAYGINAIGLFGSSISLTNSTIINNSFYGVRLTKGNNYIVDNFISKNSDGGILLSGYGNNFVANNVINNNTWTGHGIEMQNSWNNIIINNIANYNGWDGIFISGGSSNNIVSNNIFFSNNYNGIRIDGGASNNTITNNRVYNNLQSGVLIADSSLNNIVTGGSVNDNVVDYEVGDGASPPIGTTNNFTYTNFTNRKIKFGDATSWFNYRNDTGNIWLKTNVSNAATITRILISWSQDIIQWNDTSSAAITARYNITGLLPNINYNVYNNSIPYYTINSGSSGEISFTIVLPFSQKRNIKVQKV